MFLLETERECGSERNVKKQHNGKCGQYIMSHVTQNYERLL